MRTIAALFLSFSLLGCSATPTQVSTFYDYQLATPTGERISLQRLPAEIENADVILVGEWHTHAGIHRFQTDLLKQMTENGHPMVLSMEQFTRDAQPLMDDYLTGKIGEQYLIQKANAWPNYESDYRPLVEFAKSQQLPVIAANAPKPIVRCIGRVGIDYLDRLSPEQRQWVATELTFKIRHTRAPLWLQCTMAIQHKMRTNMRRKSLGMRPWRKALCAILRPILNAKFYTSPACSILSRV